MDNQRCSGTEVGGLCCTPDQCKFYFPNDLYIYNCDTKELFKQKLYKIYEIALEEGLTHKFYKTFECV